MLTVGRGVQRRHLAERIGQAGALRPCGTLLRSSPEHLTWLREASPGLQLPSTAVLTLRGGLELGLIDKGGQV